MSKLIKDIISKISKIKEDIWSKDRVLKDLSDETIGRLVEGGIFNSQRTQRILDKNGQIVGKITEGGFFDSKDTQLIREKNGKVVGRIETNFWGERIIKDESGKKIGKITKNFWGETIIQKETSYEYDSKDKSKGGSRKKCSCCGEEYDSSEPWCPYCGEE